MRESSGYQMILDEGREEGRVEEARKLLSLVGQDRFGAPTDTEVSALSAVTDLARLERMTRQLLHVASWQELLATP